MHSISSNISWKEYGNSSECHILWNVSLCAGDMVVSGWKIAVGVFLGLMVISSFIGNVLVILAVLTNRKLRRVTYFFVVSLAVADLLVSILVMPLSIVMEVSGKWFFGYIACLTWTSMDVMLCTASILNLCCISLDRYFAITRPLEYSTKRTKKLAYMMIGVTWLASVAITCPPLFGWQEESRWSDPYSCDLSSSPGYVIYSACGSFYLPLLVMTFVYLRIFSVTRRSNREFRVSRTAFRKIGTNHREMQNTESFDIPEESSDVYSSGSVANPIQHNSRVLYNETSMKQETALDSLLCKSSSDSGQNNLNNTNKTTEKRSLRKPKDKKKKFTRIAYMKERKTAKTLAIVVGCFAFCWFPFFVIYLIRPLCTSCYVDPILWTFVTWLGYFNSLCNPLIYAFYSKDFRQSFWTLTIGRCARGRSRSH